MNPDIVRVGSIAGIAASIPYLLGFYPTESLVVIGLEDNRLVFTMRMDLLPANLEDALAAEAARRMAVYDEVLVIIYTDEARDADLPRRHIVDQLLDELPVREALLVRGDRVWSYVCTDPGCCPSNGLIYNASSDAVGVAAAHVLRGRGPLGSRDQLLATLAPPTPAIADAVSAALQVARAGVTGLASEERSAALVRLLARSLAQLDNPRVELGVVETAQYLALLEDTDVRDRFIQRLATTDDPASRLLIDTLVAQAPPGDDAEACAAKSFLAYLQGDGLTARAAAERAMRTAPDHRLASMLLAAVDAGIDPRHIRAVLTGELA